MPQIFIREKSSLFPAVWSWCWCCLWGDGTSIPVQCQVGIAVWKMTVLISTIVGACGVSLSTGSAQHVLVKPSALWNSGRPATQRQTHLPSTRVSQQKLGFVPGEGPSKVSSPPPPPLAWSGQGNKAVSRLASWGRRSLAAVYSAREAAYSRAQEIHIGELAICPCRLSAPGDPPWRGLTICPCRRAAHCWCTWPGGWYSRPSPSFS